MIKSEDFSFYEKIKVPPPTFCPECRMKARYAFRSQTSLYKRNCDFCKKSIVSMYSEDKLFPVYCRDCFYGDKWDATSYAQEVNFNKPFFEQWNELFKEIPKESLRQVGKCINSEYTNYVDDVKNVYLSSSVIWKSEDVFYSDITNNSKNIVDSFNISDSELLYENIGSTKNYNCQYSYWSSNCIDSNFILDCRNCQNCFGCVNLVNKNYCIWNEQFSKEEYLKKIKEFNLGSNSFIKDSKEKFKEFSLKLPKKCFRSINCVNSIGDEIRDSKNVFFVFNSYGSENVKFAYRAANAKDSMDVDYVASELTYEFSSGGALNGQNLKFTLNGRPGLVNIEYSIACSSSNNLFGCMSLKSKQYCILNKQYTKEEYFELQEKIIKHMKKTGEWGEFFPSSLSHFGYNETIAQEYFPLNKEEAIKKGFEWWDELQKTINQETLKTKDIPEAIEDISDLLVKEILCCIQCQRNYKITQNELSFYKKNKIPIPRKCLYCRNQDRLNFENPFKLWHRKCMCDKKDHRHGGVNCQNEFETSYAPERPEIIYCEECYKREVY